MRRVITCFGLERRCRCRWRERADGRELVSCVDLCLVCPRAGSRLDGAVWLSRDVPVDFVRVCLCSHRVG